MPFWYRDMEKFKNTWNHLCIILANVLWWLSARLYWECFTYVNLFTSHNIPDAGTIILQFISEKLGHRELNDPSNLSKAMQLMSQIHQKTTPLATLPSYLSTKHWFHRKLWMLTYSDNNLAQHLGIYSLNSNIIKVWYVFSYHIQHTSEWNLHSLFFITYR